MMVMQIIGSFQVFDTVFVISNGRGDPLRSTLMYLLYFYRQTFVRLKAGYGSAMVWVLFIIIMFFTLLMFKSSSLSDLSGYEIDLEMDFSHFSRRYRD